MLVSVIIPCYNVSNYIEECLHSVYNQSYKNIEVICVDNNSNDNTLQILQNLKKTYPNLIIEIEKKAGANAARNKGLLIAKGEWIQFLDADDLLISTKIEHQLNLIPHHNNISFIAAASYKQKLSGPKNIINNLSNSKYIAPFINKTGNTCSNLWNKEKLIESGKWNELMLSSQETELMLRLILNNQDYIIDTEPLTIIRERESGQISQSNPTKKWLHYIDIRLEYLKVLKQKNVSEYNKLKNYFFDYLMVSIFELAKFDKTKAISIYTENLKSNWKSENTYGLSKKKVLFIKIFGLKLYLKIKPKI